MRYSHSFIALKQKIRELGFGLAWEERADFRFKDWFSRKREHDNALRKLYELERRQ